jgi:hypothetical protein
MNGRSLSTDEGSKVEGTASSRISSRIVLTHACYAGAVRRNSFTVRFCSVKFYSIEYCQGRKTTNVVGDM